MSNDKISNLYQFTNDDLKEMQAWSLERKVQVSQTRILEAFQKYDGRCYVSFSGGKDSTVLTDLVARVCKANDYKLVLWYSDTGLEYPEVKKHVKFFNDYIKEKYNIETDLIIDYPKDKNGDRVSFKDVIERYGYPIISKEIARDVCAAKNKPNGKTAQKFIRGSDYHKKYGDRWLLEKWNYLLNAPFKISNQCCNIMKKHPANNFNKKYEIIPIVGTMAEESVLRKKEWLQNGCNAFNTKNPQSRPMSFWTEQDVLQYIKQFNIPIATVYGDIIENDKGKLETTGLSRTGCMYCGFGCHLEKEPNRFQRLKETHPNVYEYCMKPKDEGGLGLKEVLDYIGVKY